MAVLLRATKGSNLTPTEADANLTDLQNNANSRALQTDFDDLETEVGTKADQTDLDSLITTVGNKQASDADLTAIAGLSPSNDDVLQRKAGVWINRTPAQVKTDLALAKGDVGLGNVDNTADTAKPVSTAQQTALDLKVNTSAIVNDLTTGGASVPLSAAQGVALKALIDAIPSSSTAYAAQTANQASYTLNANSLNANFSISNNLTAVALSFSNLAVGKKAIVKYSKTTASGCTITFAASTEIYNEDGNKETGVTSVITTSATTTGVFKIEVENIDGLITVDIRRWKA